MIGVQLATLPPASSFLNMHPMEILRFLYCYKKKFEDHISRPSGLTKPPAPGGKSYKLCPPRGGALNVILDGIVF